MAEVRLHVNEVKLCVKGAQLYLHGVRRDGDGRVLDHIDLILPWAFERALANLDGMNYHSLDDDHTA